MNEVVKLQRLRELLDRAVLDPSLWKNVCDDVSDYLGAVGAALVPEAVDMRGPWMVASDTLADFIAMVFRDNWILKDYRSKSIPIIKQRGYATDLDIANAEIMSRHPFYNDLVAASGLGVFVGINIPFGNENWFLSVQRSAKAALPDDALLKRVEQVGPLLSAAARSSYLLGGTRIAEWRDLSGVAERGIFLFDHFGRVIDRNVGSETFMNRHIQMIERRLKLDEPRSDAALQQFINAACAYNQSGILPPPIFCKSTDGEYALIDIAPIPAALKYFHTHVAATMMIRTMSAPRSDIATELRRRTALTGAEIRIAMAVYEGKSVSEAAEIAGISVGTARQQLKSVFRKTGTGRQAALIAWMRNLPDSPQQ